MPAFSELEDWQRRLAIAAACTIPGTLVRMGGGGIPHPVQAIAYGSAVVAAAFMLAWACEAAQVDVAHGLVVAVVAFVAILPEYIVEVHFAFKGRADYVTANLTGASRLLLGFCVAMPAIAALAPRRWRPERLSELRLAPQHRVELAILGIAAVWSLRSVVRGGLNTLDSLVLISLYALYLRLVSGAEGDSAPLVGVPAALAERPARERRRWVGGLMGYSAFVILLTAVPFGDAILATGSLVGISPYLLLQWFVPLATETPELIVAFVLLTHGRGGQSAAVLIAGAVSQYTLALGTLPLAFHVGAGSGPLPLQPREQVELFLTVAVAMYAVAALIQLRLSRADASIMLALFTAQFVLPTVFTRSLVAVIFMVLALDILIAERRRLPPLFRSLRPAARRGSRL
jgi:cation:H+ antiporter